MTVIGEGVIRHHGRERPAVDVQGHAPIACESIAADGRCGHAIHLETIGCIVADNGIENSQSVRTATSTTPTYPVRLVVADGAAGQSQRDGSRYWPGLTHQEQKLVHRG